MKKLPLIFLVLVIACNQKKKHASDEISYNVEKARSFIYVNSDSLKYYRQILQKICNPEINSQHAVLKYTDAIYYVTTGIHSKALSDFKEAIPLFEKEKNDLFLAYCYLGTGNCYKLIGKADDAVFNYLRAIRIFEKLKNGMFITVCYVNLAETCQQKNDVDKARKYLSLAKQNEPYGTRTYVSILHLEANLYGMTNRIDSALLTDNAGIALAMQHEYPDKLSPFYDNKAQCFTEIKKYDSAEYYYRKCITADSLNGRIQLMADTYASLVRMYSQLKQESKMDAAAKRANQLCDSTQYLRGKLVVYEGLNNYYSSSGNLQKLAAVKDSLYETYKRLTNEETEARVAEYNIEYETSVKEQLISKQQNDLKQAAYLTLLLTVLALMLIGSIIAVYRNYKTKRSIAVNKAIQEQKDINVQAVFESEQAERIRIARDLHDSVGQKLSVLKMYLTGNRDDAKVPSLLDDTIREIREVSHNLLPEELNFGFMKAISSDIEKLKDSGAFTIVTAIQPSDWYEKMPLLHSLNILRVFRELMSNLVNHSGATKILISIFVKRKNFILEVTDDGKGIDQKLIAESKGIGWKNIYTRINMMKGTIEIENNGNSGTVVTIQIPVN